MEECGIATVFKGDRRRKRPQVDVDAAAKMTSPSSAASPPEEKTRSIERPRRLPTTPHTDMFSDNDMADLLSHEDDDGDIVLPETDIELNDLSDLGYIITMSSSTTKAKETICGWSLCPVGTRLTSRIVMQFSSVGSSQAGLAMLRSSGSLMCLSSSLFDFSTLAARLMVHGQAGLTSSRSGLSRGRFVFCHQVLGPGPPLQELGLGGILASPPPAHTPKTSSWSKQLIERLHAAYEEKERLSELGRDVDSLSKWAPGLVAANGKQVKAVEDTAAAEGKNIKVCQNVLALMSATTRADATRRNLEASIGQSHDRSRATKRAAPTVEKTQASGKLFAAGYQAMKDEIDGCIAHNEPARVQAKSDMEEVSNALSAFRQPK
ncbi:hypothetical protein IWX50DRAFT_682945 [Phyllosticta citricarpa]|uniref:Uncharacterized protein n=1 Tax=Phyllosticta citricarpa TaxID=55181 RepID=A0ABR1L4P1_9PEZI